MKIRSHLNFNAAVLKLVLIHLLATFIFSTLVFAQDLSPSSGTKAGEEYFVLIATTSGNSLNVRQGPTSLSPVVGKLLNGLEVPLIDINGDGGTDGNWFRVRFQKEKIGWVSRNYSRKIKKSNKTVTARVANPGSGNLATDKTVKNTKPRKIKKSNKTVTARVANLGSSNLATDKTIKNTKPWANINGFRSAKFGMTMKEVKKSIRQDFGISDAKITILIGLSDEKITTINHPTEKTQSLAITIEKLLPDSGKSRVVYVFGYQTKRLIQVNILTGHPVDKKVIAQQVVNSGNLLGNHFFKKRYQEDGLVAHARLSDGSILIFRGKDQKGRMVILRLSNPQSTDENSKDLKISLNLSYIEKPGKPDIYQLREGDF